MGCSEVEDRKVRNGMHSIRMFFKKLAKLFFNRILYVIIAASLQVAWLIVVFVKLGNYSGYLEIGTKIISITVVLIILKGEMNPSYKLLWFFLILAIPIFGLTMLFFVGETRLTSRVNIQYKKIISGEKAYLPEVPETRAKLLAVDPEAARQSLYIRDWAEAPLWEGTTARYFNMGDDMFPVLVEEIEKARHFIFMEFFIINYGIMWNTILDLLEEKVRQGVDVRLIYDDFGCMTTLPVNYYREIREKGIKCEVFNPFRLIANIVHNNRDHRKFCIIDGVVGFTGGINLSDEYINRRSRFGTWKDTAVMLRGEAVSNMTAMFLQMWSIVTERTDKVGYGDYMPHTFHPEPFESEGFIQPFGDSPLDGEAVAENVYLSMICQAKDYVYICTPYLIIDNEMMTALCLAAKSGVDVRILTPGIPDKKLIFLLTRSYYTQLIRAGVKIYRYLPGFLHAKSFVCDDKTAVCGTINLDFRSLYLHFEDGVWFYGNHVVFEVKDDYLQTLQSSARVTLEECLSRSLIIRMVQTSLRLLAPLL